MNAKEKKVIIKKFKNWFQTSLIESHKKNTEKLKDINEFNINPFLLYYLSNYLEGNSTPISMAKVLVYPRVLGTSITTSFGTQMQNFITNVLDAYGSTTSGIDIEFIDQHDNRKKYCQLKSGPNAINKDDVQTIKGHFKGVMNLARTNNLSINTTDLIFCLIYGEAKEKNAFIKEVEKDYVVHIGAEFWYRFTGDRSFYQDLIKAAGEVARNIDMKAVVDDVIRELSVSIERTYGNTSD